MQQPQQPVQKKQTIHWFWWILAVGLLVWNVLSFLPKSKPEINIPYSQFISQVNAGNIANIQVSGSEITGKFVNPFPGPLPTLAPSQTVSPNATPVSPTLYNAFVTTFPDTQGDPNFMSLLEKNNVVVNVSQPPNPIISLLLSSVLPILLFLGVMVWIGRRTAMGQSGITNIGRSKAREYNMDQPKVTFSDVAGVDEAKQELLEVVDFLRRPDKYHKIGARIPRGVLLVGPPGTGKTLMARAVAGEAGVPFFSISASEFVEMFVGVGAARVRDLFAQAKEHAPCIIFVDELDALGKARGMSPMGGHDEREQTLNQLLVEMDGFDATVGVIIMAATNRPEILDPALLRAGRFDRNVAIDRPDVRGREAILQVHVKGVKLGSDADLAKVAALTPGFVGADLANLINEAALLSARRDKDNVGMAEFQEAIDRIIGGLEKKNRMMNEKEKRIVAFHESGHALVAMSLPTADPVNKVSIIPRGIAALGYTQQLPTEDRYLMTREELLDRLCVLLGGRVAEEIVFKDISTGAQNDLQRATDIARSMVTEYGMSEKLGLVTYAKERRPLFLDTGFSPAKEYSDETAKEIDSEVSRLLSEAHNRVKKILTERRQQLEILSQTLLEKETILGDELKKLLER